MSRNLYVTALAEESGKSVITLGVAEMLAHRVERLAFFRPIVESAERLDNDTELMRSRYCPDLAARDMWAVTGEEARTYFVEDDVDALVSKILGKYKALEKNHDFILCEGTDFSGLSDVLEFDFNARVARHLGAPVLGVVSGRDKTPDDLWDTLLAARESLDNARCTIAALVANRVSEEALQDWKEQRTSHWPYPEPIYALPRVRTLESPTVGEIREALQASVVRGSDASLYREAMDVCVAAMHLPNFLKYVREGTLVVTPGDRSDVLLASLATVHSKHYPPIAGVVLTGGIALAETVERLLDGLLHMDVPVLLVPDDTLTAAQRVGRVRAAITPDNPRKIATALGVFESHVDLTELNERIDVARPTIVTPLMFEYQLIERAKADRRHIVLPEGEDERILRAAEILLRRQVVDLTLLGDPVSIREKLSSLGIDLGDTPIIDPRKSPWRESFARRYFELRQHRGVTEEMAHELMLDVSYFGTMMVHFGYADGMVSGAAHTTAHTIRPALEFIRTRPGVSTVSSVFFMCLPDRVLVYGDCAIIPRPTAEQLADIAVSSAETAAAFGIEPRVALLSYSTGESGKGEEVERVRAATEMARQRRSDLPIDGPLQYDAAVDPDVGKRKCPGSPVAGRATVLIFPDLNTGNNTYKAVQRSAGAVAIGPVLQGLNRPVNDLSRGCTVPDIVNTVAITAIQAQQQTEQSRTDPS